MHVINLALIEEPNAKTSQQNLLTEDV